MSIEESMKAQADAMNNLANAMNRYAGVMEAIANNNPSHIVAPAAGSEANTPPETAAATETKRRGRKPAAAAAADTAPPAAAAAEADPFGDDGDAFGEEPKTYTAEDIRALVIKLKNQDKDAALAVLKAVGVSTLGQIGEKDYQKVVDLCAKKGVAL